MLETLFSFFSNEEFMPHGHCYLWTPALLWPLVISNAIIGVSYIMISSTLAYLVFKIKKIPFQWMYLAFGLFIITCGFTHFMDIVTIWIPVYWEDGFVRVITAIASLGTAAILPPLVPKITALAQSAKLAHDKGVRLETSYQELGKLFEKAKELDNLKTQFFSNISHDLRTPLTLIAVPIHRLLSAKNLAPEQINDLEIIERNAKILLKHVNDLLDVAKLEAKKMLPKYSACNLTLLIKTTISNFESLAEEKSIKLITHIDQKNIKAEIDPDMFQRIILNLLSNAFKFTPDGGIITVKVEHPAVDHVLIAISDSGPGISLELRDVIFERFTQLESKDPHATNIKGTGLGLTIVKELIELHRGKISVGESVEGGAIFTIQLPLTAPAGTQLEHQLQPIPNQNIPSPVKEKITSPSINRTEESESKANQGKILVVEDNLDLNYLITDTLSEKYSVIRAFDGQEGFELTQKENPDLIISDIMMPKMRGDQLIEEIRKLKEFNTVPIILLSAKVDDQLRIKLLGNGAQDYLTKPFLPDELLARVQNLVTMKKATDVLQKELNSQIKDLHSLSKEVVIRRHELEEMMEKLELAKDEAIRLGQVKSHFLGMISHEVKTPMTSLKLQLELLNRTTPLSEKQKELILRISRSADRGLNILQTLLEYTRLQSGHIIPKSENLDLKQIVQELRDSLLIDAQDKNLELTLISPESSIPPMIGDSMLIAMIIKNIISNAIKYTDQGSIEISFGYQDHSHWVQVSDTGPGIPLEYHESIFEPFEQVTPLEKKSRPGIGLGLAIANQVVKILNGEIKLTSELNRGSSFTVYLPKKPSSSQ